MANTVNDTQSIYDYLKQNIKSLKSKSNLIPYIEILTNIDYLKEFILISLEKQYKIENKYKPNNTTVPSKLSLLYSTLQNPSPTQTKLQSKSTLQNMHIKSESNVYTDTNTNHSLTLSNEEDSLYNYASNAESEVTDNNESEHGINFEIAGHGQTTIVYTDTEHSSLNHHLQNRNEFEFENKESDSESESESESENEYVINQYNQYTPYQRHKHSMFKAIAEMTQIGDKNGIAIQAQFGENGLLSVRVLNMGLTKQSITDLSVGFRRNCLGINSDKSNEIILPKKGIEYNQCFGFVIQLRLDCGNCLQNNARMNNNKIGFILRTNVFDVECVLENVPMFIFFDGKNEIKSEQFLHLWKTSAVEKQCKLQILKCKMKSIANVKQLLSLQMYNLSFVHHRIVPKKGNILYYSTNINESVLLIEIAIAINGKGSVVTRSNDKHQSVLCSNFVRLLLDTI